MLKPALLYKDQLQQKFAGVIDDLRYKYYFCEEQFIPELDTHVYNCRQLVSINSDDEVLGYISYNLAPHTNAVYDFGAISFVESTDITFSWDVLQSVDDVFLKYNMNKLLFGSCSDNPAVKAYHKICETAGGREVGIRRENVWLYDNTIHDYIEFEIMRNEYIHSSLPELNKRHRLKQKRNQNKSVSSNE